MSFAFGKEFFSRKGIGWFAGDAIPSAALGSRKIPSKYVKS